MSAPARTREQIIADWRETYPDSQIPLKIAEMTADGMVEADRVIAAVGEPPACPPWCGHAPGHEYDGSKDGAAYRLHQVDPDAVDVTLSQQERNEGGTVTLGAVQIDLWAGDGQRLDSKGARKLAAELIAAADRLDEITTS